MKRKIAYVILLCIAIYIVLCVSVKIFIYSLTNNVVPIWRDQNRIENITVIGQKDYSQDSDLRNSELRTFGHIRMFLPWDQLLEAFPLYRFGAHFKFKNGFKVTSPGQGANDSQLLAYQAVMKDMPSFLRWFIYLLPRKNSFAFWDGVYGASLSNITLFSPPLSDLQCFERCFLKSIVYQGGPVYRFKNKYLIGHIRRFTKIENSIEIDIQNDSNSQYASVVIFTPDPNFSLFESQFVESVLTSLQMVSPPPSFIEQKITESRRIASKSNLTSAEQRVAVLSAMEAITNSEDSALKKQYGLYLLSLYQRFHWQAAKVWGQITSG